MSTTKQIEHSDIKGNLLHRPFKYQQTTDPALTTAVVAGDFWLDTTIQRIKIRNDQNTSWDTI